MKGTLFSADFIEDASGNLRLLEVNTDTSVTNFSCFDYSDFIALLQANNITEVTIIHKPLLHQEMVDHLKTELAEKAPFITAIEEVKESPKVIYPATVPDRDGLFVLRLAYDETSIFDSEYAKGKLNLLSLFYDAFEKDSVVEFYHSSDLGTYDSISKDELNSANIPDAVAKNIVEAHRMARFYKVGTKVENESNEDRWNNFIKEASHRDVVLQKYHINTEALQEGKSESIRAYSIVYGPNLDLVHLAQYKKTSIFEIPGHLEHRDDAYANVLDTKHFFEFATNYIKYGGQSEGILNTHLIIEADGKETEAGDLVVGDTLKSYYVNGTSLSGEDFHVNTWAINGKDLPEGSYMTSSVIVYKNVKPLDNKTLIKLNVENNEDSIYISPVKSFLVWDSAENILTWKTSMDIVENVDYLINFDGSTVPVTSNELFITNEDKFTLVELDVEDTDTYIIAGTTPINSFITHNAPCFVAGTSITLADGTIKKIEDIQAGDVVSTFDLEANTIVHNTVNAVLSKKVQNTVEYRFDNGETLRCTFDHPIYVVGKGWTSFNSELSNQAYSLEQEVKQVEIGDTVKLYYGEAKIAALTVYEEEVSVYNLQDIEGNHNFFANNILVHNRICFVAGTKVTMENGELKNIEDVQIDEIVLSFNEQTKQQEPNRVVKLYKPIHDDLVEYTFSNGTKITSTYDHPFYVNGLILASYRPDFTSKRYEYLKDVQQIKVGDKVNTDSGEEVSIVDIAELEREPVQTYIINVENNNNFYANNILVHNK